MAHSGLHGFTVRVRPSDPELSVAFVPGLICWAEEVDRPSHGITASRRGASAKVSMPITPGQFGCALNLMIAQERLNLWVECHLIVRAL